MIGLGEEVAMAYFKVLSQHSPEDTEETLSQDSRCSGWDSNRIQVRNLFGDYDSDDIREQKEYQERYTQIELSAFIFSQSLDRISEVEISHSFIFFHGSRAHCSAPSVHLDRVPLCTVWVYRSFVFDKSRVRILIRSSVILFDEFRGVTPFSQTNAGNLPKNRPLSFPSASLQLYQSHLPHHSNLRW